MPYVIITIVLVAAVTLWLVFRSMTNRSYEKGRYHSPSPENGGKQKKWDLKSDGHIEAEEAVYAEQMQIRYAYYREILKNPPEIKRMGNTVITTDDEDAAQSVFAEYEKMSADEGFKPVDALVVIKDFTYKNVWYLSGLKDLTKAAVFQDSNGQTVYMPAYKVLVVMAGDIEGLHREYAKHLESIRR